MFYVLSAFGGYIENEKCCYFEKGQKGMEYVCNNENNFEHGYTQSCTKVLCPFHSKDYLTPKEQLHADVIQRLDDIGDFCEYSQMCEELLLKIIRHLKSEGLKLILSETEGIKEQLERIKFKE